MDLNLIELFDALLHERSVTRVARRLGMSQSAVSHALNRLRAVYGDPLFVRAGNTMKPTPACDALAPKVAGVMAAIRHDLLSTPRFDPATTEREFRLCATDMGEVVLMPRLIERLRVEAPAGTLRTLRLPQAEIAQALESGEVDLAFGSLKAMPPGLYQQQLFSHRFVTIVSARNHDVGERLTPAQFSAMRHVVVTLSRNQGDFYDEVVEELGLRRRIFFVTPHFLVVPTIIATSTDLVATVPQWLVERYALPGTVRTVQPPFPLPGFALRQHWHPRFHHDAANMWLRGLIGTLFEGEAHEASRAPRKRRAAVKSDDMRWRKPRRSWVT